MFKFTYEDTRKTALTSFGVFIVNFEDVSHFFVMLLKYITQVIVC